MITSQTNPADLLDNLSMPPGVIIPVLGYDDVPAAAKWLCETFGFQERLRIGNHRAQLVWNGASVVATTRNSISAASENVAYSIMVQVADVDAHFAHVQACSAQILSEPETYPFGERQYSVVDIGGHHWTFTQSVVNIDPATWGGSLLMSDEP